MPAKRDAGPQGAPPLPAPAPALEDGFMEALLKKGGPAFLALRRCIERSGEPCEGNLMHTHGSFQLETQMDAKRRNIVALARALPAESGESAPRILEIGFNAGHSACLMLLAHPTARVVAFDLCEHGYCQPCAQALRSHFGPERLELYAGPSGETLPAYRAKNPGAFFDLLHIDGGHQYDVALADMENCLTLARSPPGPRSLVVLDDTDITGVFAVWSDTAASGRLIECATIHEMGEFKHAIGEFVRDGLEGVGTCGFCGTDGAPWACSGCKAVRYCNEACARRHWRLHKTVCESRRPPPLSFPSLGELTPSSSLRAAADGSLRAARDLAPGLALFSEAPTAFQVESGARSRLCSRCGAPVPGAPPCAVCGQAVRCPACAGEACAMCPELKITKGHVGAFTLLVLDLVRRREARELPHAALPPPGEVGAEHMRAAAGVQRVGHWCSAVRWPDERCADVLAATLQGRLDLGGHGQALGIGYYAGLARLRAAARGQDPAQGNVRLQVQRSPEHTFTLHAVVSRAVPAGAPVYLGG